MKIYNSQTVEMTQVSKYLPINLEITKCTASIDYDIIFILFLEAQRNFIIIKKPLQTQAIIPGILSAAQMRRMSREGEKPCHLNYSSVRSATQWTSSCTVEGSLTERGGKPEVPEEEQLGSGQL